MGLFGEVASFGRPAEQPIIPFPFREIAALGQQVQARADRNNDLLSSFGDNLLQTQVGPKDQVKLREKFLQFQQGIDDIYEKNGGVMSDVRARNASRNLVRQYANDQDIDRYTRNFKAMTEEQKKVLSINDYRAHNDLTRDLRKSYFAGEIGTDELGLYSPQTYLENQDIDKKLDSYINGVKASGDFSEYVDENGEFIRGRGFEGVTAEKLTNILGSKDTISNFFSSNEGQEFVRREAYKAEREGRPLTDSDLENAYLQEIRPRINEAAYGKTRNTIKGNPGAGTSPFSGNSLSQNVQFGSSLPTLNVMPGLKLKEGKYELSDDVYEKVGYYPANSVLGDFGVKKSDAPKTSTLPKELQENINIAYALAGKKPSNNGAEDIEFYKDYVNEFYESQKSQVVNKPDKHTVSTNIEKNLNDFKGTFRYRDPESGEIIPFNKISEDGSASIKYVGTFRPENPYGPNANLVEVVNEDGSAKQYIADGITSEQADQHQAWALSQGQHYSNGYTVFAMDPKEERRLQDVKGMKDFKTKENHLKSNKGDYIVSKYELVDNKPVFVIDFYEDGKKLPKEDVDKLMEELKKNGR
jgi:hypothetical protein